MGYTHYWSFKTPKVSKTKFRKAVALFRECFRELNQPELIFGPWGEGKPVITNTKVSFNGNAETGEDHETCYLSVDVPEFSFCKTARKDYDIAVCLCLLSFKEIFGDDFDLSSDGVMRDEDSIFPVDEGWKEAYEIFDKVVGK